MMILAEYEAKRLLEQAQIPVIPVKSVRSFDDAAIEAQAIGYPVVLKLSTAEFSHKTDIGGVFLNLRNRGELERAFAEVAELRDRLDPDGNIIIEAMADPGAEFFVGTQRHSSFGPVMSLGIGGVWLELFKDVSFRLLPATRVDFEDMLQELKAWPKLHEGFRHLAPVQAEPLVALMATVAAFVLEKTEIEEMDLNPIIVYADRALVVDARIVVASPPPQ